ncbi:MAG: VTT domain-containing protein [Eubacteriales bacterium]|nr:VTT domain-containing protein [Eubacteriales bacterium]
MRIIKKLWSKVRRRLPALGVLLLTVVLIWLAFGKSFRSLLPLIREGDGDAIVTYLSGEDAVMGMVSVALLSALQVASIVMPGLAIHIAAGVLYNWWKAFLLCYGGFVGGNMAVFWFVRHLGKRSPYNISLGTVGTKVLDLLSSAPPMFVVIVAFMIPGVPNGIVPYLAAKTGLSQKQYFVSTAVGSWLQILASCIAGDFLIRGNIMFGVIAIFIKWAALAAVLWKREWLMELFM